MFRFVTKKEYWDIEDSGMLSKLPRPTTWHLKTIQDAVAFSYLHDLQGKRIAEVGGGNSRLLPALAKHNTCCNIEPFEGAGSGPKQNRLPIEITNFSTYLGDYSPSIPDKHFDVVFSLSVVEHIPNQKLSSFFSDNIRIMKSSGLSIHLIDIYCGETPFFYDMERHKIIKKEFFKVFYPLSSAIIGEDELLFRCSYATNPDNTMHAWNKVAPTLQERRETHQSCTLILAGIAM